MCVCVCVVSLCPLFPGMFTEILYTYQKLRFGLCIKYIEGIISAAVSSLEGEELSQEAADTALKSFGQHFDNKQECKSFKFLMSWVQSLVMKRLEMRPNGTWGAKGGRRLVVLVEDLHLAAKDQHHARPLHEAVREALQQTTW